MTGKNHSLKTGRIKDVAELDPETLGESTAPDFTFKYIDLSSVKGGRIGDELESMTFAAAPGRARKLIKEGDVLLGMVRPYLKPFAKVQRALDGHVASTGFAVIRAKSGVTDPEYLYQTIWSDSISKQIHQMVTGSNYPALSVGDVKDLKIPLPPIDEQRKIAEILRTWDEAIETAEAELKAKQERKRGLMQKLFTPSAEGARAGSASKNKGSYRPLGALVTKIEGGGTPSKEVPGYWNGDIPLLTIKDLPNAHLGLTVDRITTNGLESSSSKIVPSGIPVIATRMDVGRVVRCPVPVAINQDLRAIYPDKDMVDVDYIVQVLPTLEREFLRYSCGSTVMGIGIDDLKSVKIYLPPLAEQRKIAEVLQSEDEAIDALKTKAELLRTQKRGLMQKLLTGEVRVKV